jgi:hypothetical protein
MPLGAACAPVNTPFGAASLPPFGLSAVAVLAQSRRRRGSPAAGHDGRCSAVKRSNWLCELPTLTKSAANGCAEDRETDE